MPLDPVRVSTGERPAGDSGAATLGSWDVPRAAGARHGATRRRAPHNHDPQGFASWVCGSVGSETGRTPWHGPPARGRARTV